MLLHERRERRHRRVEVGRVLLVDGLGDGDEARPERLLEFGAAALHVGHERAARGADAEPAGEERRLQQPLGLGRFGCLGAQHAERLRQRVRRNMPSRHARLLADE